MAAVTSSPSLPSAIRACWAGPPAISTPPPPHCRSLGSHSESQQGTPDVPELGPAGTVGALLELIDPAPGPVDVRPALPRPALFLETEKLGLLEVLLAGEGSKQGVVQHIAGKLAAGLVRVERLQAIRDDV